MSTKHTRKLALLASLSVYALNATPALAQEVVPAAPSPTQPSAPPSTPDSAAKSDSAPTDAASPQSGGVEDIVVTAQRRSENLQKVPISITALTSTALARAGINQTAALQAITPGLQLPTNRNAVQPYIRGVGSQNVSPGDEGSSAIYVDGILYSVSGANVFALNNIERIEVLKGPQGTLFGRNAVGGLINVITRDPDGPTVIKGSVGYENYDTYTGSFYAAGRLAPGIAADLSVNGTKQNKGWGYNSNLGVGVNLNKEVDVRSKLVFTFDPATHLTLSGDYSDNRSDIGETRQALPGTRIATGLAPVGSIYDTTSNLFPYGKRLQYGFSAKLQHDFGWATFTSTSAYRHYNLDAIFDQDGASIRLLEFRPPEVTSTFQQEFLLNGDAGRLKWTTGLFYFHSNAKSVDYFSGSTLVPSQNYENESRMLTNSYAGFAQGTYSITDSTRATIGLRYTHDTRQLDGVRYAAAGNPLPVGTVLLTSASLSDANRKPSFNKLTWRFALDQQITRDVLVYASASRGFKSGVFNVNTPNLPAVQPETLDAYEAGIKSDLFDHVLRLNVSAYYSNYSNIQLTANLSGSPQLINAAKGRIKGVDAELTFAPRLPVGNLEIRSAVSFLDAKFTSFPGGPNFVPRPAPAGGNVQTFADFAGNYFQSAPRFTSTVSTSYDLPVGPNRVGISATWYHNGGFFWDPQNRVRQDGYDLLSGQLYYAFGGDRFKLRTYVRNLTNKRYFSFVSVSTTGDLGIPAPPRTYGVAFDFNF